MTNYIENNRTLVEAASRVAKPQPRAWKRRLLIGVAPLFSLITPICATSQAAPAAKSPGYESSAGPLRNAPDVDFVYAKAKLGEVLRAVAEEADISFFNLPSDGELANKVVTFKLKAPPFVALEQVAKATGVNIIHESGVWYLRPKMEKDPTIELVGRTYQIKFNAQEVIKKINGTSNGGSNSNTSSGAGSASTGIELSGPTEVFEAEPSELIEGVKQLLEISTAGVTTSVTQGDISVSNLLGNNSNLIPDAINLGGGGSATAAGNKSGAKVIWSSDSNTLYVVATREQHELVEGYLSSADRPQPIIAVELKFFETTKDPRTELGIDWSGTLEDRQFNLSGLSSPVDLNQINDIRYPMNALLSTDAASVTINAIARDLDTTKASYPRLLTRNNREVSFQAVINQPVLAASSSTTPGAGATSTSSVTYLPIGTVVNVLPKQMDDGTIMMNVSITVSSIIGQQIIDGNPYPVASSRVYNAQVKVEDGYTLAIGGLDEAKSDKSNTRVPGLGRLPALRYIFGSRVKQKSTSKLMMFLTPTLLSDGTEGGVAEKPQTTIPVRPDNANPARPRYNAKGEVPNSLADHNIAIDYYAHRVRVLDQMNAEGRLTRAERREMNTMYATMMRMLRQTQATLAPIEAGTLATTPEKEDRLRENQLEIARLCVQTRRLQTRAARQ